jgi:hypothetical protein
MLAVFGGRFADDSPEEPVEMGQGFEADLKGNLTDPVIEVQ